MPPDSSREVSGRPSEPADSHASRAKQEGRSDQAETAVDENEEGPEENEGEEASDHPRPDRSFFFEMLDIRLKTRVKLDGFLLAI